MTSMRVFTPVATSFDRVSLVGVAAPALPSIEGNAFAVLRNGWKAMEVLSGTIREQLLSLGAEDVHDFVISEGGHDGGAVQQAPAEVLEAIASECAGAISGLGH
jgi:hypothetical protein